MARCSSHDLPSQHLSEMLLILLGFWNSNDKQAHIISAFKWFFLSDSYTFSPTLPLQTIVVLTAELKHYLDTEFKDVRFTSLEFPSVYLLKLRSEIFSATHIPGSRVSFLFSYIFILNVPLFSTSC